MIRYRRIAQLWSWLPAFRGVAEHEGIHDASVVLGTSPSALSRTVKLLEESLGRPLFVRGGNSMALTPFGAELLAATRDAMRRVDEAVLRAELSDNKARPLTVFTTSGVAASVVGVVAANAPRSALRGALHVKGTTPSEIAESLLRGHADVVVATQPSREPLLHDVPCGFATVGVYASREHALAGRGAALSASELGDAHFVARDVDDGFSDTTPRTVVAFDPSMDAILLMVQRGALVALPDVYVRALGDAWGLVRLCDAGVDVPLFATTRANVEGQDTRATDELVLGITACLA
jgi:LysR family hydrogen peroxide-inducible transcriptional activator